MRVGIGTDTHRLAPDLPLVLGGVSIQSDQGLIGHSDADVLIHAIIDSLLGAAALGDIGTHFPDSETEYSDISSMVLLGETSEKLGSSGYVVTNVDVTLIAEVPKIAPHVPQMRANVAEALNVDVGCISVKATTTEGLGPEGVGDGMSAMAVSMIEAHED